MNNGGEPHGRMEQRIKAFWLWRKEGAMDRLGEKRKESSESAFFSLSCPPGTNIGDYDFITPH